MPLFPYWNTCFSISTFYYLLVLGMRGVRDDGRD